MSHGTRQSWGGINVYNICIYTHNEGECTGARVRDRQKEGEVERRRACHTEGGGRGRSRGGGGYFQVGGEQFAAKHLKSTEKEK